MVASGTTQQYEGAILNQLIKNAERLAVLEQNVGQLQTDMAELKTDVTELKTDVAELKTDMVEVKAFVFEIKATMSWVKWFLGAIGIGVLGNLFSQPILSALHLH